MIKFSKILSGKAVAAFRKGTVGTLCMIVMTLFIMSIGCADNEKEPILGTKWKLVGIVDVQTGELKEIVPRKSYFDFETGRIVDGDTIDCEECYTLTVTEKAATWWQSKLNTGWITFFDPIKISLTNIPFSKKPVAGGTRIGESPEPSLYISALQDLTSYIYDGKTLKLFYSEDRNYLLFKLIDT
jgi:hypothetical protein